MVQEEQNNGLSKEGAKRLSKIIQRYPVFFLAAREIPPAGFPHMSICLKPGYRPVHMNARRYSSLQRIFLIKYVKKLEEMGFVQEAPMAEWQVAPLLVPKQGPREMFPVTFDLQLVNAATITESWPIPHPESELSDFSGNKVFASLDLVFGYWQLPMHQNS